MMSEIIERIDYWFNKLMNRMDQFDVEIKALVPHTSENGENERVYIPDPDYTPPMEEFPTITREEI